jgi:Gas vesicle synthesis protein GvpL/GvpF
MADRRIAREDALYLYGISRSPVSQPAKILNDSIDAAHPVQALESGDFICWVSAVDREGFSAEITRNRENLEWLALHGVRHQQVVAEIAAKSAVVPARFGTIFSGEQALRKNVQSRKQALEKVFDRISDADEWGVKIFAEQPPPAEAPAEVRSGKEYLQQKASRLKRQPERDDSGLQEFVRALEKIAADSAPTGKISGVQPDLLWQATFLVPRARRRQWEQTLQQFVKKWDGRRRIEINGPWPPYSFVSDAE